MDRNKENEMNALGLACLFLFVLLLSSYVFVRFRRSRSAVPIPSFLTTLIDHPLRRRFVQPPKETARRHGIQPGMRVLEVGPGRGTYSIAAARAAGENGQVVAIDIEPRLVEQLTRRALEEGVINLEVQVGDACNLNFDEEDFDLVFMIAVLGEIPHPDRALREFHRVLRHEGVLAISELLPDPDYVPAEELIELVTANGFRVSEKVGHRFYYTLLSEKV
jgi:ubiquinone/menaquinone biosynthesis C-methylase UbiE